MWQEVFTSRIISQLTGLLVVLISPGKSCKPDIIVVVGSYVYHSPVDTKVLIFNRAEVVIVWQVITDTPGCPDPDPALIVLA